MFRANAAAATPRRLLNANYARTIQKIVNQQQSSSMRHMRISHLHLYACSASSSSFGRSAAALSLQLQPLLRTTRNLHSQQNTKQQQQQSNNNTNDNNSNQQQSSSSNTDGDSSSSSSSSSSSTSFNPLRSLFRSFRLAFEWYARKLDTHPVKTQSLTSGFLFLIGDMTAQRYEDKLDRDKGIDTSDRPYLDFLRLAACTSFGLFVLGPFGHHWYSRLDVYTNRLYAPRTLKNVGLKVFLDTAIFNPIFLVVFFTVVSLLEGLTMQDIGRKLYRDFVPSYAVDCSVWPPIQTVNFRFVPVKFQLLVVNLGCYFDDVFLSYVQHNGMPYIFQSIERSWLEWIGDESVMGGHGAGGHGVAKSPDATPLIESLPGHTVKIVPTDATHPHQPHTHPISSKGAEPLPHHHLVPRVLSETEHHLHRAHGVDIQVVQELDADWTEETVNETEQKQKQQEEDRKP